MKIIWQGRTLNYDAAAIDVKTGIVIRQHTGLGLKSWSKAVDDLDPVAVQALMWIVLTQNGERHDIAALNFSVAEFMEAFTEAALTEMVEFAERHAGGGLDPTGGDGENIPGPTPTSPNSETNTFSS